MELPFPLDKYLRLLYEQILLFLVLLAVAVALLTIPVAICYLIALRNYKKNSD